MVRTPATSVTQIRVAFLSVPRQFRDGFAIYKSTRTLKIHIYTHVLSIHNNNPRTLLIFLTFVHIPMYKDSSDLPCEQRNCLFTGHLEITARGLSGQGVVLTTNLRGW